MEMPCLFGLITAPAENHCAIGILVGIAIGIAIGLVLSEIKEKLWK